MGKEETDKPLSELDDRYKQAFNENTTQIKQITEGFREILVIVEQIKTEEITLFEGQQQIDEIVDEYDLPRFRY